jgi:hypothetical protein
MALVQSFFLFFENTKYYKILYCLLKNKGKNSMTETAYWTNVVNTLRKFRPELLKLRDTDHQYRVDTRDIIEWKGEKVWVPVGSLAHPNIDDEFIRVKKELLEEYNNLQK